MTLRDNLTVDQKEIVQDCLFDIGVAAERETEIFDRAHIQHIRKFLLHGVECVEISDRDYKQRLNIAYTPVKSMMRAKYPDEKEYEDKMAPIYDYASAHQDVYMEIGLQCGMILAIQLLENNNNA